MIRILATIALAVFTIGTPTISSAQAEVSDEHKLLHKEAGTWDATLKLFVPGADGSETKGVEVNEVVCGGTWVRSHFKAEMMGTKFEGIGMFSYNSEKKKYFGFWGDSTSSHPTTLEGEYDADSKTFTYQATSINPGTGEKMTNKHVIKWIDDSTRVFTIYTPDDEKMIEVNYKKRSGEGSSTR